jgi:NADPH-dependent ferric siderophore reductase
MGTADSFPGPQPDSATGPVFAAAARLAALPAPARHAWLAAHLAALRAGRLTLKDLP